MKEMNLLVDNDKTVECHTHLVLKAVDLFLKQEPIEPEEEQAKIVGTLTKKQGFSDGFKAEEGTEIRELRDKYFITFKNDSGKERIVSYYKENFNIIKRNK